MAAGHDMIAMFGEKIKDTFAASGGNSKSKDETKSDMELVVWMAWYVWAAAAIILAGGKF